MKIFIGQIYSDSKAWFPFSTNFQKLLGEKISSRLTASEAFNAKYGAEYNIIFRMSAKRSLQQHEIKGPQRYPKSKTVEYSIFLAYDVITVETDWRRMVITEFLDCLISILKKSRFETRILEQDKHKIIESVLVMPGIIDDKDLLNSGLT